jgi:hypothetical protein
MQYRRTLIFFASILEDSRGEDTYFSLGKRRKGAFSRRPRFLYRAVVGNENESVAALTLFD